MTAGLPYKPPTRDAEAAGERLTTAEAWSPAGYGHIARYHLAAGFCRPGFTVLDAACGVGYGAEILAPARSRVRYVGVDRRPPDDGWPRNHDSPGFADAYGPVPVGEDPERTRWEFHTVDLNDPDWVDTAPTIPSIDVAVSFETAEHLPDPEPLFATLRLARVAMIVSVPLGPTSLHNPWHLTDFDPGELRARLEDDVWAHVETFGQPSELSEVSVFMRRKLRPGDGRMRP